MLTTTDSPSTRQWRVLLAEDDPAMLSLCRDLLRGLGAQVVATNDGLGLLDLLERHTRRADAADAFDLVVTDHRLPGATGAAAVDVLRRYDAEVPVLVISAFADDSLVERLRASGNADVLPKPFEPKAFDDTVRVLLDRARSGGWVTSH